jgi:tetratricopeptide (TPR) repeat protein
MSRLRHALVLLVLLTPASPSLAQTRGDQLNLRRLEQAAAALGAGELQRAESLLNAALAVAPRDPDALNLFGVLRARQQRGAEAEGLFRRALNAEPTHLGAHVNLGELLITTGRENEALQTLLAAHRLAPDRPDVNVKLASLYGGRGEHERAIEHLRRVQPSAAGVEYFPLLLKSLLALKRQEEARSLARAFADYPAADARARAEFAVQLARGGLVEEALGLLEAARAREPRSFQLLFTLGFISAATGRQEKAEAYLTDALAAKPDDVETLRVLASVARTRGDFEKSLAHLIRARRVAPESPRVLYDFGVTTLQMGLLLDALNAFEQLHRAQPHEPAYLYGLAATRLRKGERAEAVRLLKEYVALRPNDASGFYLLGAALHSLEQPAEARAALEQSLRLRPDADAEYLLGETLAAEGNYAAAVELFRRVVRARPAHAAAHAALGTAYREQGDFAGAKAELERAVELDPDDLRANYQLGLVYARFGDKEGAKKMFARADELRGRERRRESVILKLIDPPQP